MTTYGDIRVKDLIMEKSDDQSTFYTGFDEIELFESKFLTIMVWDNFSTADIKGTEGKFIARLEVCLKLYMRYLSD